VGGLAEHTLSVMQLCADAAAATLRQIDNVDATLRESLTQRAGRRSRRARSPPRRRRRGGAGAARP
jgi:hypothetical protein